ncbi:MAG: GAF domain-containing sensor histidine kinase [Bdellovibrionota bacterium]
MSATPEIKSVRKEVQGYLWFLECLDQINRAFQETNDLEEMMARVLETMLSILDCDRVWLVYPCNPNATSWQVQMERTKPEYPGATSAQLGVTMDVLVADAFMDLLESTRPVKFEPGKGRHQVTKSMKEKFGFKSVLAMALYPKGDKPWVLGLHQCSYARVWTPEEEQLFQEIGRRLSDGLTSLLAYRSLQQSEEKFRRMVETASEGVWAAGADGIITFVNARMASMLGYSVGEMLGRLLTDFIPEEDRLADRNKMEQRRRGAKEIYERRLLRRDGSTVWTLSSASPIFDENHEFDGSFVMETDISDRKRAEADLVKAKEAAENAARIKSRFLDIAAHELRTPVTAMTMALEFAQRQTKKGNVPEPKILDLLQRQAIRLGRLVVDLLDVSRLDRGAVTLHRAPTNLVALIDSSVEEFSIQEPKRRIQFVRPQQSIVAPVDPLRVQQVLSNLIDNALKYTPENRPVEVTTDLLPDSVRISVTDHGAGITEEQQVELFKPFNRGSTDREVRASGLGLGLVVSRGIVNLHGGTIGVRSKMGEGSTFYFDLPRVAA